MEKEMNERIFKLVGQARKYAWENETHWSANAEREALFEEKFAELIVLECVEICREERSKYNMLRQAARDPVDFNMYAEGGAACDSIHMQIRKTFGVNRPTNTG